MSRQMSVTASQVNTTLIGSNLMGNAGLVVSGNYAPVGYRITFSSTQNLSGITFTISGVGQDTNFPNFAHISETIAGPNNNSDITANAYSSFVITASGPYSLLNIGVGASGNTSMIGLDKNLKVGLQSIATNLVTNGGCTYALYYTLANLNAWNARGTYAPTILTSSAGASQNTFVFGNTVNITAPIVEELPFGVSGILMQWTNTTNFPLTLTISQQG